MDISKAFLLLGYVSLQGQPFKLEVEKILPELLGKEVDVLRSYHLVFETILLFSETMIFYF